MRMLRLPVLVTLVVAFSWRLTAQAPKPAKGTKFAQISEDDLKQWLSYLASDELQGRQVFTEGYGLAASYIAEHLRQWGVKPLGDGGSYFQTVKLRGYREIRHSAVTVEVNGQTRTFEEDDHIKSMYRGGNQTRTFDEVEFVGWSLPEGVSLKGKAAVLFSSGAIVGLHGDQRRGSQPGNLALASGAEGLIDFISARILWPPASAATTTISSRIVPDFSTVEDPAAPNERAMCAADETFFEFLLSGSTMTFAEVKDRIDKGEDVPSFPINAKLTIAINKRFEVATEQLTRNVVGMIEGTDPALKDSYVMLGAHLDHVGYSQTGVVNEPGPSGCRRRGAMAIDALTKAGKTPQKVAQRAANETPNALPFDQRDLISNGADDDGSGSVAELGIAKAFATGPKPKRSIVFVWHAGEEAGLYGSRYNVTYPIVPLEKVQAVLNMDMIGRDDCNDLEGDYTNSVFVVGADRISTDLHNIIVQTNNALMPKPLVLDYELNDPKDPENVYRRSDHYSYAEKGIPVAFFTTGQHPDYHRVTDTVDKITFPKMARIAQLVYETGFSIADTERILERDNKGPRTGFGSPAVVIRK